MRIKKPFVPIFKNDHFLGVAAPETPIYRMNSPCWFPKKLWNYLASFFITEYHRVQVWGYAKDVQIPAFVSPKKTRARRARRKGR